MKSRLLHDEILSNEIKNRINVDKIKITTSWRSKTLTIDWIKKWHKEYTDALKNSSDFILNKVWEPLSIEQSLDVLCTIYIRKINKIIWIDNWWDQVVIIEEDTLFYKFWTKFINNDDYLKYARTFLTDEAVWRFESLKKKAEKTKSQDILRIWDNPWKDYDYHDKHKNKLIFLNNTKKSVNAILNSIAKNSRNIESAKLIAQKIDKFSIEFIQHIKDVLDKY